jgi:hypothetical protein
VRTDARGRYRAEVDLRGTARIVLERADLQARALHPCVSADEPRVELNGTGHYRVDLTAGSDRHCRE